MQPKSSSNRVVGLDSVRAFAALSVFLAHIIGPVMPDLLNIVSIGFLPKIELGKYIFTGHPAVIVFFVVSGFCIHYPYVQNKLSILAFWAARLIRIMIPALAAILLAKFLNIAHFNFIDGYILWSIVCELFYYMFYPFFYYLTRYFSWLSQFLISLIASYLIVTLMGSDEYGNAHIYGPYLNWLVGLPSWLVGCILAEQVAKNSSSFVTINTFSWRVLVCFVASFLYWLTANTWIGYYLTMNIFSVLVFFWVRAEILAAQQNGVSIFESVGRWSYSIYLFHMIVFSFLVTYMGLNEGDPITRFVTLPAVLLGCYMAYFLIEKNSHELARLIFKRLCKSSNWKISPSAVL